MYNVNTDRINELLNYVEHDFLPVLSLIMDKTEEQFLSDPVAGFAAERIFHVFIEVMTDVGNLLIDGFIMRDPGSYEDIVDILEDESVYPVEAADVYRKMILFRKQLIADYNGTIRMDLHRFYAGHARAMQSYPGLIRDYLAKELW